MSDTNRPGPGRPRKSAGNVPAIIEDGKSYPLTLFKEITGLGDQGVRDARDAGLRVVYVGKSAHVLGSDWLAFLANPMRSTKRWTNQHVETA